MKEKDRDILDDIFRSKFQDFEMDTSPEDWQRIVSRLPEPDSIPLRKRWPYWAAAVISLLLVMGGGIYLSRHKGVDSPIAEKIEETQRIKEDIKAMPALPIPPVVTTEKIQPVVLAIARQTEVKEDTYTKRIQAEEKPMIPADIKKEAVKEVVKEKTDMPDNRPAATSSRKWRFGMGAGSLTEGSGNTVNTYVLRSNSSVEDRKLLSMNALSDVAQGKEPKTNVKHKTPVSFGLSVSRQLNNRFSLQTGLTYSFLSSSWETQASTYNKEILQRLHFIGIPLSLTYTIADWNRFRFYASAGAQAEFNIAGRERTKSLFAGQQISVNTLNVRMKEWQWSVNARAGVSYPLLRFVSAYAEFGAAYYFDNNSEIETIYSDKAFNISPQIGLRLNF
ncbi:MAG: PorT family protein [Tannerellaceae bacterium]|jgi:opacity protein-like surface antigen|nr:PorT family protein [Tannerellaceae bacterium]